MPRGRVAIRYWEKWTGAEGQAIQRVVDGFNGSQDRVWVERIPISDIVSKAMVAIGGGDPPDVVGLYSYNIPLFAEAGALVPLDSLPGGDRLMPMYAPAVGRLLSHEGRQWAGVNTCYTLALYYNASHFREAGIGGPPGTIEELDECSRQLTVRDRAGRIERAGFLQSLPFWWPYVWPVVFGGRLFDPATNRATLTEPESLAAYEWVSRTAEQLGRVDSRRFASSFAGTYHSAADPFLSGRVSMIAQGPWIANFARRVAPGLDYGCVPLPEATGAGNASEIGGGPAGLLEADVIAIPRGCRHLDAAWEFVRYTQRQDVQELLARDHCKSSPMAKVSDEFWRGHDNAFVAVHDRVAKSPRVRVLPQTRAWQQYSDLTAGAFDAIWSGASVAETLARVNARAQAVLDQARALRQRRTGTHA
ncbi:MAG: extracellular solute-binding protein [Phycisphaerae bacterium]|nr:extracellular solute-binding protein [Phycisphaerae bacterium]